MAITGPALGSLGSPVERLRSLTDTVVTISTLDGDVTGTVLSCTRLSVWLVCDDVDVVLMLDEVTHVRALAPSSAA